MFDEDTYYKKTRFTYSAQKILNLYLVEHFSKTQFKIMNYPSWVGVVPLLGAAYSTSTTAAS